MTSGLFKIVSSAVISRNTLQGLPAAKVFEGIDFVTTLPAPITQLLPISTPGQMTTLAPNQQLWPMVTG